jgi:hypothetical protein
VEARKQSNWVGGASGAFVPLYFLQEGVSLAVWVQDVGAPIDTLGYIVSYGRLAGRYRSK